ncbi:hypothetical protein N665_0221s0064 [Sinapis alba]|nr:hypothetical protein N665_0221s0064 [Sinapis alba]
MDLDREDEGHPKRKQKIPKHQRREANEKKMDSFVKRVSKIPLDIPFDEAYYTHMLWMFFRESRETKGYIEIIFNHLRERMKQRTCLKNKSDPEKFAVPCLIKGNEYPCVLCDIGSSISIMSKTIAEELNLQIEPSNDSFTFVDCSKVNSRRIVKDVPVQINNTLVPVEFHVMDIQIDWNSSLLLGREFMATVGAICDMKQIRLYISLIDQKEFYEPVKNKNKATLIELSNDAELVATCFCNYEFNEESEDGGSINTQPLAPIDGLTPETTNTCHADGKYTPTYLEYDEDYIEEEQIEYCGTAMEEAGVFQIFHHFGKLTSIDGNHMSSIDTDQEDEYQHADGAEYLFGQQLGNQASIEGHHTPSIDGELIEYHDLVLDDASWEKIDR